MRGRNLIQIGMGEFCNAPVDAEYAREQGVTVIPPLDLHNLTGNLGAAPALNFFMGIAQRSP